MACSKKRRHGALWFVGCGDSRMGWQVADLTDNLAADLDGSLSALGVDLTASSYNMSEALLALPSLTVFKQEAPSPSSHDNVPGGGGLDGGLGPKSSSAATQLHQFLHQQGGSLGSSLLPSPPAELDPAAGENIVSTSATFNQTVRMTVTSVATSTTSPGQPKESAIDSRFQYVLAAATSIATKVNEATLTYLNQGQSYEIKLKKLGDLSLFRGKILKSVVRICFHERRLQYTEREQMASWQASRPGERIIEVDVPLSYGLYDVVQDQSLINTVDILWDATKEVGVYIKVNCISTEFTPKKHGGEKGVPFRIQVETFLHGEEKTSSKRLHAAACQIKVFKLKGADRKHKQDREKMLKRPMAEQDKFQPSYDCTVLTDIPVETLFQQAIPAVSSSVPANALVSESTGAVLAHTASATAKEEREVQVLPALPAPPAGPCSPDPKQPAPPDESLPLSNDATAQQTTQWLQRNRFDQYLRMFLSFSGADILRLTRDDLIQICGLADGIRLYNALHARGVAPRLTVYLCVEQDCVYHALYLAALSCAEMAGRLAHMLGVLPDQIRDVYLQGPGGIHVLVTDDVVRHIKDEAMFAIEILQAAQSRDRYRLLLKPVQH
ncbi:transcription factor CP2-like protein 1 isoform X3 [Bacillus rossius redtenbacheri]|uniref:transcription factor CP2-like protein 1 isoform X3 n=1 Tax=Bacillus rossius redtenbacheri TaxID=93214 RepID=UPI002FDDCC9E